MTWCVRSPCKMLNRCVDSEFDPTIKIDCLNECEITEDAGVLTHNPRILGQQRRVWNIDVSKLSVIDALVYIRDLRKRLSKRGDKNV